MPRYWTSAMLMLCGALLAAPFGCSSRPRESADSAPGISQLVETRDGRKSCWGVVISLSEATFNEKVQPSDLSIVDGKYGRQLKDIMTWEVSRDGKVLTIRFKPGMGDFGSGNGADVKIETSAFRVCPVATRKDFSIPTDLL